MQSSRTGRRTALLCGAAFMSVLVLGPSAAEAQAPQATARGAGKVDAKDAAPADLSEVVVTGSSLRGVPPVGSNLIELGREEVVTSGAITVQDLLSNVPQFGTFNKAPAPAQGSAGNISTGPNLRGIGIAQTLSLLNGHRLVGTGHLQNNPDPSIVPPSAVERVEVVADGASAIYGSDAISGVVNIITRKNFNGAETTLRYGVGVRNTNLNASQLFGKAWSTGSILGTVEYTYSDRLRGRDLELFNSNLTSVGGLDNRSFNCADPNVRLGTVSYAYPALAVNTTNRCDNAKLGDVYPRQNRFSVFLTGHQEVGDRVELFSDVTYSDNRDHYFSPPPAPATFTINNTNPFFIAPPGTNATSEQIQMDLSRVIGDRLNTNEGIKVYGATVGGDITLPRDFKLNIYASAGHSDSFILSESFNPAIITSSAAGTTAATALDPFTGKTSAAVVADLKNFQSSFGSTQELYELSAKVDGSLLTLAGGPVKVAVGVDLRRETYDGYQNTGRYGQADSLGLATAKRNVKSVYGELFIPLFSKENAIPGFARLDASIAGRYDDYSDFGNTSNPKYGIDWSPVEWLTFRGSYGTSFHAPALPDLHGPDTRAQFVPNNSSLGPPGGAPVNLFVLAGSNPNLGPETAKTRSFGVEFEPTEWLPGFQASATYYKIEFQGLIDFPRGNLYLDPYYIQFAYYMPTPAKVQELIAGLRIVGVALPLPPIGNVLDLRRKNLGLVDTDGIDFAFNYQWSTSWGQLEATLSGDKKLSYDTKASPVSAPISSFDRGLSDLGLRASLSDVSGPFRVNVAWNYSSDYKAQYVTTAAVTTLETIDAFQTVEVHLGYKLADSGWLSDTTLSLDVENLFNEDVPTTRSGTNISGTPSGVGAGNPLGRVVTFGISKKW